MQTPSEEFLEQFDWLVLNRRRRNRRLYVKCNEGLFVYSTSIDSIVSRVTSVVGAIQNAGRFQPKKEEKWYKTPKSDGLIPFYVLKCRSQKTEHLETGSSTNRTQKPNAKNKIVSSKNKTNRNLTETCNIQSTTSQDCIKIDNNEETSIKPSESITPVKLPNSDDQINTHFINVNKENSTSLDSEANTPHKYFKSVNIIIKAEPIHPDNKCENNIVEPQEVKFEAINLTEDDSQADKCNIEAVKSHIEAGIKVNNENPTSGPDYNTQKEATNTNEAKKEETSEHVDNISLSMEPNNIIVEITKPEVETLSGVIQIIHNNDKTTSGPDYKTKKEVDTNTNKAEKEDNSEHVDEISESMKPDNLIIETIVSEVKTLTEVIQIVHNNEKATSDLDFNTKEEVDTNANKAGMQDNSEHVDDISESMEPNNMIIVTTTSEVETLTEVIQIIHNNGKVTSGPDFNTKEEVDTNANKAGKQDNSEHGDDISESMEPDNMIIVTTTSEVETLTEVIQIIHNNEKATSGPDFNTKGEVNTKTNNCCGPVNDICESIQPDNIIDTSKPGIRTFTVTKIYNNENLSPKVQDREKLYNVSEPYQLYPKLPTEEVKKQINKLIDIGTLTSRKIMKYVSKFQSAPNPFENLNRQKLKINKGIPAYALPTATKKVKKKPIISNLLLLKIPLFLLLFILASSDKTINTSHLALATAKRVFSSKLKNAKILKSKVLANHLLFDASHCQIPCSVFIRKWLPICKGQLFTKRPPKSPTKRKQVFKHNRGQVILQPSTLSCEEEENSVLAKPSPILVKNSKDPTSTWLNNGTRWCKQVAA